MSLRLYMDQHVSRAITEGLRRQGIDVLTAYEDGASEFDDARLLDRATELDRVLFSQDRDLLVSAHARLEAGYQFAGLIYAHQLNITPGRAIRDLALMASLLESDEMSNRIEFIPL